MRVYLLRHAERDSARGPDPGLSPRGLRQALHLAQRTQMEIWDRPDRLIASPKRRAQETLARLSELTNCPVQIHSALDERQNDESPTQFTGRVRKFLQELEQLPGVTFICSHLDWVDEAMIAIPSSTDLLSSGMISWPPGGYMIFEVNDGIWQLLNHGGIEA